MIEELRIRDLGVIADATLPLGPGFTAITGETGAGKTMVVTALGLLMGARADSGAVRNGSAAARVGGLVHTTDPRVAELVADIGGETEAGELTLTRTVSAEGRSRASVGGSPAPIGSLGKLAERLFAVHGQSDQLRLRSASAQRDMLDRFGGVKIAELLAQFRDAHDTRLRFAAEHETLTRDLEERRREAQQLRSELEEIEAVDPLPDEETQLRELIDRLSNLEELRVATASAMQALATDGIDPYARDASSLIEGALRDLERVEQADTKLAAVAEQLREASARIGEVSRELANYAADLDADGPQELAQANERLAQLTALTRRYGESTAEVLAYGERAAQRLTELDGDDDRIDELAHQLAKSVERERQLAAALSEARTAAASELSQNVTAELQQLALPDAELIASVEPAELSRHGADAVQLLLRPHRGTEPRPIAAGASGGELSRVMLAIEVVVAASDPVPTFVFDEIDAGVGGAAAIEIARRLARLARTSQVIVVTHLAQVAAFANNHLRVQKDASGEFTESSCVVLTGEARVSEMARLLSGLADSSSAHQHARELLTLGSQI